MILAPPRGAFSFYTQKKSHHETVMAKFNFTANFAERRAFSFFAKISPPLYKSRSGGKNSNKTQTKKEQENYVGKFQKQPLC